MQVHKALLISTTCQRLGLGFYVFSVLASQFMGVALPMNIIAIISLVLLGAGGIASAFHLGRPARFFNAFSNLHSHLTQEALLTPFLGLALVIGVLDGTMLNLGSGSTFLQWITVLLSLLFLISTGLVYQLSARPAWNTGLVLAIFLLTAAQVGSLATMVAAEYFTGNVPAGLMFTTVLMFLLCGLVQYLFIQRLKTLGYGVAVTVTSGSYKATFQTWVIFGLLAIALCLLISAVNGSAMFIVIGTIASMIGIIAWTVLYYMAASKVKMFPMYQVDLNVYF